MTETLVEAEAPPSVLRDDLGATLERWVESPPPDLSAALAEQGVSIESLEDYARSGLSTEDVERLRKVLVQGSASGSADDAALLARLQPILDPRERAWDRVLKAKNSGELLNATVTEAVKGGVVVDLGVRGFVPSSQIGLNVPRNLSQFIGRTLRLRVLEVDRRRQTVILSNRQVLEEDRASKRRAALGRLQEGEDREGVVRRLTDIGAFVDVGGIDGLLHVSEISWKRVEHPSDLLKVGQKVQVKVLKVDPDNGRISLSMRRLMLDPWEEARKKYPMGATVNVKIASTVAQGAIVELDEGLEGFIPISELAGRRISTPEEVVQPGQEVDAVVIDLRPRERRIVFSLRKLEQKRERQVVDTYQKRTRSTGEKTTLGDLFGHLFEEYEPEPEAVTAPTDGERPVPELAAAPPLAELVEPVAAMAEQESTVVAEDSAAPEDSAGSLSSAGDPVEDEELPGLEDHSADEEDPAGEAPIAEENTSEADPDIDEPVLTETGVSELQETGVDTPADPDEVESTGDAADPDDDSSSPAPDTDRDPV